MPLAAIAVHQMRFFLAYGDGGRRELAETGHSYLHSVTPWIVLVFAIGIGGFLQRLSHAWRDGHEAGAGRARRSLLRLWLTASAALILIYAGQEALEGLLSSGHAEGIAGIFGDGGWWAVPAALAVAGGLMLLIHGGRAAIRLAARLGGRRARRHATSSAPRPAAVLIVPASPLARCAPGRAPPAGV